MLEGFGILQVISVGVMTVGVLSVGVITLSHFLDLWITFKDVLRFEERNKNVFFLNSEGNLTVHEEKKNRQYKNVISPVHLYLTSLPVKRHT